MRTLLASIQTSTPCRIPSSWGGLGLLVGALLAVTPAPALAFDTGVSDDRVSLPEGPGALEGVGENVSVDDNMGLMRYGVSVELPNGFDGLTPDLSFTYTSGGGSSVLGMGWSMELPSIERMTMRGVPRYDETDRFVADGGNELVRVFEGVSASAPAVYRQRFESSFTRYTWHDRDGGKSGYWQAEYADGRVGFFGADRNGTRVPTAVEANGDETFKYHLVELVDVYGHRTRFDYVKDGAVSLVSTVAYVFTDGQPTYRVALTYEGRSDNVSDAKAGFDRILTRRLAGVRVETRGQQLRRYALSYEDDAQSGRRTRLRRIESFGSTDTRYPVVHGFGYSRGLGAQCDDAECGRPLLVDMTNANGLGVTFQSGTANLVDINGDALPDLVDASTTRQRHRFFVNQLASDGAHTFANPTDSVNGQVSAFSLNNPRVQFIDVNGDGFTDLLSGGTTDQQVLLNDGSGDWAPVRDLAGSAVWTGADAELRFMDYDNDMDVDLLRSTATETLVFENDGAFGFTRRDLAPLGVAFSENIQFTDMNGDGLLEIVQLQAGVLRYKTNFGRGRFAAQFTTLSHPFDEADAALALVEDLDGDGYADIVVATGDTVRYVLNRNGESFEPLQTLDEASGRSLPNRESTTTVLAADMNGNGSVDVVWVSATGVVQYLDLFPVRSHLLTRIENGLGRVTAIEYQPSVQQRALSAEEGSPWIHPLPHPMVVVSRTDEFDLLTDVHDVVEYRYRDGFYDGVERQFRGYGEVVRLMPGDASTGTGRILSRYDVGRTEPHLNGTLRVVRRESDDAVITETTNTYGDPEACPVAEVPDNATLIELGRRPIGFACMVATETVVQEGLAASEHVTTRSTMEYGDGYGNVTKSANLGVIAVGGGACSACARGAAEFGAPCGNQCLGDERFVERTYVDETSGRWIINVPATERAFGVEGGSPLFAQTDYYYDGDAFVGLPAGQLTQGKLTRTEVRVDDTKTIQSQRQRFDAHGNVIETLDPLASIEGQTHRRRYRYDDDGLRVVQTEVLNRKPDGTPYQLRRNYQYDGLFDRLTLASAWILVEGDTERTAADATAYTYDVFGRRASTLFPGDNGATPTFEYTYDLGNPTTRLIERQRSVAGGTLDLETIVCVDGRGRTFQTRTRLASGRYIVDGFTVFNLRSQPLETFQAYESSSANCDEAPPTGVVSQQYRYDGVGRRTETIHPDTNTAGGATTERYTFQPLRTLIFDGEDGDAASPHHETPTVEVVDGLGRIVRVERNLVDATAVTHLEYDALGHSAGFVDADGNVKKQTYDAVGRLLSIVDPSAGTSTYGYDDASNVVEHTDARGVTVAFRFDGLNREVERFDAANPEATRIATEYDSSENCEASRCANTAGHMVMRTYPAGADFFGYDLRRRPFTQVRVIEGKTYELETRFDNANRAVERIYPDGRTLGFDYDGASRIVRIDGVLDEATYSEQGLPTTRRRVSGVVDTIRYDQRLRVVGVDVEGPSGLLQAIDVGRDRASNVLRVDDAAPNAMRPATKYTYDAWYRSTEADLGGGIETMTFDLVDRMRTKNDVAYTYGDRMAPTSVGDAAMDYDPAGYVTRGYGFDNTWDFLGRMVSSAGQRTVRSVYGADHRRVARHDDGGVTHYVASDFEVRDGISVIYARIGEQRIARLESADFASTWLGRPSEAVNAGTAYRERLADVSQGDAWLAAAARRMLTAGRSNVVALHHDHLGSVTLATGADAELLGRRAFGVFGAVSDETGWVDRYGFTGQEHEPHTGFIHFAHRFLSTESGLWLSPDPAFAAVTSAELNRLPEAIARYSYVLNNAGTLVDPDGLKIEKPSFKGFVKKVQGLGNRIARIFRRGNQGQPRFSVDVDDIGGIQNVRGGQPQGGDRAANDNASVASRNSSRQSRPLSVRSFDSAATGATRMSALMLAFTPEAMEDVFRAGGGHSAEPGGAHMSLPAAPPPAAAPPPVAPPNPAAQAPRPRGNLPANFRPHTPRGPVTPPAKISSLNYDIEQML
ncbi:MAG: toxin TcdB middle/N-terminal domain-containing protein [Deltaproteobacteria bacterium]